MTDINTDIPVVALDLDRRMAADNGDGMTMAIRIEHGDNMVDCMVETIAMVGMFDMSEVWMATFAI